MRKPYIWNLRTRRLELGRRTLVMGILNVTPDSFSDGGLLRNSEEAIDRGLQLFAEGADIVDIGGESTRPGAKVAAAGGLGLAGAVSAEEELARVLPVVEGIRRAKPTAVLSIDTYKAAVARQAVEAGAEIVNDVSGFTWDAAMAGTIADVGCGAVLMHMRGRPEQWRNLRADPQIVELVKRELRERAEAAIRAGVGREKLLLDPGFGFGKNFEENYPLLATFEEFAELGFPLLAATSRKSFLGRTAAKRIAELSGGQPKDL